VISREDGRLVVRGRLTMETVPALFQTGLQHLAGEDLLVDLSQVEAVDSSAVSMLLGWSRAAQQNKRSLRVAGVPEGLASLAALYGVAEMLPQESA
jgi:phospholipid transport system transporter-binding protein